MKKIKFYILLFSSILLFFIMFSENIHAEETIIYEFPTAKEITYGDRLYKAELIGGSANTKGTFLWKNELEIANIGIHERTAIFIPSSTDYNTIEFNLSFKVNKRKVTLNFEKEIQKQYDGTNILKLPNYIIKGIIDDDTYVTGIASATTESILVGENIPITIEGLTIIGNHKDSYYLDINNLTANICPKYIEKVGQGKITFNNKLAYVSPYATLIVNKIDANISKRDYYLKSYYEIYLESNHQKIDINTGNITLKLKVDNTILKSKRIHMFNYVNNQYEEVKYTINDDGYITYTANNLGSLVIMKKKLDFTWLYIILSFIILVLSMILFINLAKNKKHNHNKIIKYKSLKRRKDYGNN